MVQFKLFSRKKHSSTNNNIPTTTASPEPRLNPKLGIVKGTGGGGGGEEEDQEEDQEEEELLRIEDGTDQELQPTKITRTHSISSFRSATSSFHQPILNRASQWFASSSSKDPHHHHIKQHSEQQKAIEPSTPQELPNHHHRRISIRNLFSKPSNLYLQPHQIKSNPSIDQITRFTPSNILQPNELPSDSNLISSSNPSFSTNQSSSASSSSTSNSSNHPSVQPPASLQSSKPTHLQRSPRPISSLNSDRRSLSEPVIPCPILIPTSNVNPHHHPRDLYASPTTQSPSAENGIPNPASSTTTTPPSPPSPRHPSRSLKLITSKLLPYRHQSQPQPQHQQRSKPQSSLKHKSSIASLVESIKSASRTNPTELPSLTTTDGPKNGSFALKSFRNVRTPIPDIPSDSPNLSTHEQPSLQPSRSITDLNPSPSSNHPNTNNNTLGRSTHENLNNHSRPTSIISISRPSSPTSKISAAAFREARAARNSRASIASSFSDLMGTPLSHPPSPINPIHPSPTMISSTTTTPTLTTTTTATKTNPNPNPNRNLHHSRIQSYPGKLTSDLDRSDLNPSHLKPKSIHHQPRSRMSAVPPLISRIPDRRQTTYSTVLQDGSMASNFHSPTSLYAENDILVPPRPAFYGSPKPPNRSLSSDHPLPSNALYGHHHPPSSSLISSPNHQHPPTQPHHSSRQSFYTHQFSNRSVSSIHSVPSIPVVRIQPSDPTSDRRRSSTTTKPNKTTVARDQRQLDQWHSDDDDDNEVEEEDEDEDDDNDHKGAQRKHAKTSSLGSSLRPPSTANLHVPKSSTPHPTRDAVQPSHSILKPTTKIARRKPTNCQPRETDEDNVPLSMLIKKKSASSLKDLSNLASATTPISAAQTLTKGRQRLNKSNNGFIVPPLPANWPPSFAQPHPGFEPSHSRRTSAVTISGLSTDSARRASKTSIGHVPGVTVRGVDGQSVLRPILHPRGNSPASSSSRSGSGTWSIPITPHDSIGSMTQLLPPSVYYQDPQSIRASISSFGPPKSEADSVIGGRTASLKSFSAIQGPEATSPINHDLGMNGTGLWGGVRIEDLGVPAGVDPYLYSALGAEQKIQLHQRSQLMMQMMAAQTQAAIQMHAMALSKSQKAQQPLMNQQASGAQMNPVDPTGGNLYGWGTLPPMPLLDPSMLMNNPNNPHQLAMMTPSMMNVSPHQTPRPQPQPNPSLIPAIKPKESKNESELMKPFDRAPSTLSLPTPIPMGGGAHDDESKSNGGLETKE